MTQSGLKNKNISIDWGTIPSAARSLFALSPVLRVASDTTPPAKPSALALASGTSSPGNDATPAVEVTVAEAGGKVTLYSDSACTTVASEATSVTDTSSPYKVTVDATALTADGAVTFHAKHADASTNASACSTASVDYTYDGTDPGIEFPTDGPRAGSASAITLTDATAKVKSYGAVVVAGTESTAAGCDTAAKIGSALTTLSTPSASVDFGYVPPADSVDKKVCAYVEDAAGNSQAALWATAIEAGKLPDLPTDPSLGKLSRFRVKAGNARVAFRWAEGSSSVRKVQYQQKEGTGAWGAWTDIPESRQGGGNRRSYTVTGLSNGTAYTFRIRAVSAKGAGPPSDEEGPVTPAVNPLPGKPHGLRARPPAGSSGAVALSWEQQRDDDIDKWQVAYRKASESDATWSNIRGSYVVTDRHTVKGLDDGVEYVFQVRAVNAAGTGPASDEARAAPGNPDVVVHGIRLRNFRVEAGDDRLELRWSVAGDPGYCGYVIEWRETGATGAWERRDYETWSKSPAYTIGGLKPGTSYDLRVLVKSGYTTIAPGLAWERTRSTTGTAPVEAPAAAAAPALEWARVNGAELALRFDKGLDESSAPSASAFAVSVAGSARSVSAVGVSQETVTLTLAEAVEAGDSVTVGYTPPSSGKKLRSTAGGEVAAFSGQTVTNDTPAPQRQAAAPLAPAGLAAAADGRTAVSLSWTAPPPGGGRAEVTGYEVRQAAAGGAFGGWTATGSTSTSHDVGGLDAGTSYRFEVRATSTAGASPASNEATATTEADPVPPEAPAGLTATADGRTAVSLSWTAPAAAAGRAEVTGYEIRHGADGEAWGGWTATGSTSASHDVGGLEAGTSYRFEVRATSAAGASSASNEATATTEAAPPLTGSVSQAPAEHDGTEFSVRIEFSEDVETKAKDARFRVRGGSVAKARRVNERRDLWQVDVQPDAAATVTLRLPAGAASTADGRTLSERVTATITGRPGVSVADARVKEAKGAKLAFEVTLSAAADKRVMVQYATSDGSAVAGEDYKAKSGRVAFQPGETAKTIEVKVFDDAHDEGEETLTLTLSEPTRARLADAEATGTIENADLMPAALLARFGRATAEQVVEHIEERMAAPRERGFRARFAGRELQRGGERDFALGFLSSFAPMGIGPAGAGAMGSAAMGAAPMALGSHAAGPGAGMGMPGMGGAMGTAGVTGMGGMAGTGMGGMPGAMGMAGQQPMGYGSAGDAHEPGLFSTMLGYDPLADSEFELNRESRGGILSVWSRSSRSYFSGMEDALSLNGDVRTTMIGADYARGALTVGLSVGRTLGLGGYSGPSGGRMSTSMTGFYPWVGYQVNDRVSVWGVTGYGTGALSLTPDGASALETGVSMAMTAVGTRGELIGSRATGGFSLAFKADALWVGAGSDLLDGAAGRLNASDAGVTRVRTALEGSRGFTLVGGRLSLTPSVEVGLRRDGGDAETGAGMDLGGGLAFTDTVTGLSLDVRLRTLVVHQAEGFTERGMSLSLGWDPTPSSPLGLTARVAPSWGGQATGGAEALWGNQMAYGMGSHQMYGAGGQVDAEVGYGLPVGARFVGTPRVGLTTSPYGRDYRVGYGLGVLEQGQVNFELGVDAQRRESPMQGEASNGVMGRATLGW